MKLGVVVITYNISTEIFLLQIEAIRKFCKDDFEICIIDNSSDFAVASDLEYHSRELGLYYKKTFASSQNGSDSHTFASNFSYQMLKDSYTHFHYLDHDCLPVKTYSVIDILGEDKVIAGVGQNETHKYFWPGCVMFKRMDEIDFAFSHQLGLDTGGGLRKIIEIHGMSKCIFFNEAYYQNPDFDSTSNNMYALINNGMFFHCIAGSNWKGEERHSERMNSLINIVKEKINAAN